jgi:hypothetical protein
MLQTALLTVLERLPSSRVTISREDNTIQLVVSLLERGKPLSSHRRIGIDELTASADAAAAGQNLGNLLADELERQRPR